MPDLAAAPSTPPEHGRRSRTTGGRETSAPLALLALAVGAFGIGTTEFVIVGLLPDVANDLSVSIPHAGMLITGYALGVVAGVPITTAVSVRVRHKTMLTLLMGVFIVGNLICALAPTYGVLMTGRLVAAFCHGSFFGIGSVVAASVVKPAKQASAVALMFTGLTIANVMGVPLGTFLGQQFGWRSTFWCVSVIGVFGLLSVVLLVPSRQRATGGLRDELAVFRIPQVWLALTMTTLGFAGVFASFTYLAPMMTGVAGFSAAAVPWLLVLFGAGLTIGNVVGGKAADQALMPTLYAVLGGLAVVLSIFVFTARSPLPAGITVAVFGAVGFGTVPPLQMRVMRKAKDAPALASAANIAAFNLGNALGAWLSGTAIAHGMGYTAPNWIGALLAAAGLGVALLSGALDSRASPHAPISRRKSHPAAQRH